VYDLDLIISTVKYKLELIGITDIDIIMGHHKGDYIPVIKIKGKDKERLMRNIKMFEYDYVVFIFK